jgi:hypothetical protein
VIGEAAAIITKGPAFESVLESAGREKVFMLRSLYKFIFGEFLPLKSQGRLTIWLVIVI